jgi:AraC family transcriptional regulator
MERHLPGTEKYNTATIVATSVDRGWHHILAELRDHSGGVISRDAPLPVNEVVIDVSGASMSMVTRKGSGLFDKTVSRHGTVWLCPGGSQEDLVLISERLPGMLHLYLDPSLFASDSLGEPFNGHEYTTFQLAPSFADPLVAQIGLVIADELRSETPGGRLLVESLACSLAARMLQVRGSVSSAKVRSTKAPITVSQQRLRRVVDYIDAHIEQDLTLDEMANIACISRFHFIRAFKSQMGVTPCQYVSRMRIERAKILLRLSGRSIAEIARTLQFSSQSTFTRAFRSATGYTPVQYTALR